MFSIKTTCGLFLFAFFLLPSGTAAGQASGAGQQASVESISPGLRPAIGPAQELLVTSFQTGNVKLLRRHWSLCR